jgi:predicted ester cyclase
MTGTNLGPIDPPGWAPTGRRIDVQGVDVYVFRGERLAEYRAHYDTAELARQLGLLPSTAPRWLRVSFS